MKAKIGKWIGAALAVCASPWVWGSALVLLAAGAGFGLGVWRNICAECPSIAQIHTWEPRETSKVYSRDGQLIAELGEQRRTAVPISALPEHLPQAFIAIEDRRFYEHRGVDPRGVARAVFARLVPRSLVRALTGISLRTGGASTITQQLARDLFEGVGREVSLPRKLREIQVALELERAYEKDQILEAYLNQVYLGPGWYGVQTASRNYFGKDAATLNPAESALLAAVVNNASVYSPFRNPDNALQRRNLVLNRMAIEGFLTEAEAERWKEFPLPDEAARVAEGSAPYFVEWIRQLAEQQLGSDLYIGGYTIETTLDLDMQRAAELAMLRGWSRIESNPIFRYPKYADFEDQSGPFETASTPYVQGAFVAVDPETGGIRAMVGGRDFDHSKFNRVTQALRQPGSSFKSFVYAAALAQGIPASRIILDAPYSWPDPSTGEIWSPRNFDGTFHGEITLREAYRTSNNTAAVWLADDIGLETVAQTAQSFGIRTRLPRVPSMAIGSTEVIPLQITEAYTVFANLGTRVTPFGITRILDAAGNVVFEQEPIRQQVFDPLAARLMVTMMESVVDGGSGAAIRGEVALPTIVPAAGKTGTTNSSADVWFVGFTPNLMATVWFGFDDPRPLYEGATSGEATRAWGWFMRQVYYGDVFTEEGADGEPVPAEPLLRIPERWPTTGLTQVVIDARTGLRASNWCSGPRITEYYLPGTEPQEFCDENVGVGGRGRARFGL